jgi:hypothetical protein
VDPVTLVVTAVGPLPPVVVTVRMPWWIRVSGYSSPSTRTSGEGIIDPGMAEARAVEYLLVTDSWLRCPGTGQAVRGKTQTVGRVRDPWQTRSSALDHPA